MKNTVLFALLAMSAMTANANGLSIANSTAITFSGYDGQPAVYTGARSSGFTGEVWADVAGTLEAVYLGQESANVNRFRFQLGNAIDESDSIGTSIFRTTGAGLIDFRFRDLTTNTSFINGSSLSFAILNGVLNPRRGATNYGPFDFLVGLNDNGSSDGDFDDMVIGLRYTPASVPVPAALPLFASALGLLGFGAARRRL